MISSNILLILCAVAVPLVTGAYQQCAKQWIKEGCRIHSLSLAPLIDERGDKVDWDNYGPYLYDLMCRCRDKALAQGYEWFAVGNYAFCASAKGPLENYLRNHPKDESGESCIGAYKSQKTIVNSLTGEICAGQEKSAYFYRITNNGVQASAPQEAEEVAAEQEAKVCTLKSDVLLLIDVSGSIDNDKFFNLKQFLLILIDRLGITSSGSRLGLIRYDTRCYIDMFWPDSSSKTVAQLKRKILDMFYTGGSTLTDNALKCARDKMIKPFKRPGVPVTIFVMTDGNSWNGDTLLPPISLELKDKNGLNCTIISIGVGAEVSTSQLAKMASDSSKIFLLESFKNLAQHAAQHLNNIISKACL